MKNNNLISSYARVLFSISEAKLGIIRKEVEFLLTFFADNHEIFMLLSSPTTSFLHKKEIVLSMKESINENLIKLIMVVLANKRSGLLIHILRKFLSLVMENKNELEIIIKSAYVLKEPDIKIITESLGFLGKIVKVSNVIDPSIMGGFIIKYGFNLIDASLKSYLDRLVDLTKVEILKVRNIV
ncbi:MAG: ATP synthase subunit delta [Wolbachia endosymbiont of Ctenocephalides orientis wCori]|nr:MAG: ATP synthase subunit delta [Wolbachia endosymbiont of Ctenocephalides orientis wCori]